MSLLFVDSSKIVLTSSHVRPALYLLLRYMVRHALVRVAPHVMRELSLSQRSFGRLSLKTTHRMIDDYLVKAPGFGLMFSERSVGIIWQTRPYLSKARADPDQSLVASRSPH
jgi:hypothetical protein